MIRSLPPLIKVIVNVLFGLEKILGTAYDRVSDKRLALQDEYCQCQICQKRKTETAA